MVADPKALEQARQMLSLGAGAPSEPDSRIRSARLSSAATIAAARTKCKCEACLFLRRLVELTLEEAHRDLGTNGTSNDPPA